MVYLRYMTPLFLTFTVLCLIPFSQAIIQLPFPVHEPEHTDLWVHCFSQRAMVYFGLQDYKNCIVDLDEALQYTEDTGLKILLVWHKNACIKALAESKDTSTKSEEIQVHIDLSSKNELLEGVSDDIELMVHPVKGRTIRAKRDLKVGTLVTAQPAFVVWLHPSLYHLHCNHCLKALYGKCIPCQGCPEVRYCSWECSAKAWKMYHSRECEYLSFLRNMVFGLMGIRFMTILGIDNLINDYISGPKNYKWEGEHFGDDLRTMTSLVSEMQHKDAEFEWDIIVDSLMMAVYAERMGLIKRDDEHYYKFCTLVRRTTVEILLNCFHVYEESITRSELHGILLVDPDYSDIGFAVYSSSSMFSHSCDCNANRFFIGSTIYIHLSKDVASSEEITIDYGADTYHNSSHYRKTFLKNSFGFECHCHACADQVENVHYGLRCPNCKGTIINDASVDYSNYCMTCGKKNIEIKSLLDKVKSGDGFYKKGEKYYHREDYSKAKRCFKKSLRIYNRMYSTQTSTRDVHLLLSSCYLKQERYTKACHHAQLAVQIQEVMTTKKSFDYINYSLKFLNCKLKVYDDQVIKSREDLDEIVAIFKDVLGLIEMMIQREVKIMTKSHIKQLMGIPNLEEGLLKRIKETSQ